MNRIVICTDHNRQEFVILQHRAPSTLGILPCSIYQVDFIFSRVESITVVAEEIILEHLEVDSIAHTVLFNQRCNLRIIKRIILPKMIKKF